MKQQQKQRKMQIKYTNCQTSVGVYKIYEQNEIIKKRDYAKL